MNLMALSADATGSGSNVNDKVVVTSTQIDKQQVYPNDGEGFEVTSQFQTNGPVNAGDYFTVDMPQYSDFEGIADYTAADNKIYPTITNNGEVIANGVYDVNTKRLTYTFTDYVSNKDNIQGSFTLPQYIDRETAKTSGKYNLTYNVAGENTTLPIDVVYNNYNDGHVIASADSLITQADIFGVGSNDYTQYIYVNPTSDDSYNTKLTIQGYQNDVDDSSALLNPEVTNIQIFDAVNSNNLNPSFYVDDSQFKNVTDEYSISQVGDKVAQIDFGHIDHPYIVKVTSKFDPNSTADLKTRVRIDNANAQGKQIIIFIIIQLNEAMLVDKLKVMKRDIV